MRRRVMIAGGGTGGHAYPALNIARAIRTVSDEDVEVLLIGAKRGMEARLYPASEFECELLPFEPIYRRPILRNWRLIPSVVRTMGRLGGILGRFDPALVVGTGGYVSGPVVARARLGGRRTAIQEQNRHAGITTRWLAPFVDQLHLGYEEAIRHLRPGRRTLVRTHGNPIAWPDPRPEPGAARRSFGVGPGRVLLASGGSQGAASVNAALVDAVRAADRGELPPLPDDLWILWSTGPAHHASIADALPPHDRVVVVPYIDRMDRALAIADLAISRAGALALAELCAWGIPSVLVPFPFAAGDHQTANARALRDAGAACVVEDERIRREPGLLWRTALELLSDSGRLERMRAAARSRGRPEAARRIAADLMQLMGPA